MPQIQLPIFPEGIIHLSSELAVKQENGQVVYFNGMMPVFTHAAGDIKTFRMITSQFCVNGTIREVDITRAFGIPAITVKRAVKKYREGGAAGFYQKRKVRAATILTASVLGQAQQDLYAGKSVKEVALELGIKYDTLKKAVADGRLKKRA